MLWSELRLILKTSSVTPDFFYVFYRILSFSTVSQSFKKSVCGKFLGANVLKAGWLFCPKLPLGEKSTVHKNFCCWSYFGLKDLHEFIFAGGTIGNKFVSKFKMSLWEKMLLSIKTVHFNFTLIRLNNKSSPQFIRLK